MNRTTLIVMATAGSILLLIGAWAFQHLGGLAPCKLCIWQRWPHGVAAALGLLGLGLGGVALPLLGAAAALTTAGIGMYHTGVERGWWDGPSSCSSGAIDGLTPQELLAQIQGAPLVQCDQVAWQMLGLSMASWNAVIALILATIWFAAAMKSRA